MPRDWPPTPMAAGATVVHELYRSYVEAGFTEEQAMQIILTMVAEQVRKG
jgi:hypothetical protein